MGGLCAAKKKKMSVAADRAQNESTVRLDQGLFAKNDKAPVASDSERKKEPMQMPFWSAADIEAHSGLRRCRDGSGFLTNQTRLSAATAPLVQPCSWQSLRNVQTLINSFGARQVANQMYFEYPHKTSCEHQLVKDLFDLSGRFFHQFDEQRSWTILHPNDESKDKSQAKNGE